MEKTTGKLKAGQGEIFMRYDQVIRFVKKIDGGVYDPAIGKETPLSFVKETKMANVTSLGTNREKALFGEVTQTHCVIRLLQPYIADFDHIELQDGTTLKVATKQNLRQKQTFICEEVVIDGN